MANTKGGGALIVGVDNATGDLIGADTDPDWLRNRIHQLTDGKITATIRVAEVRTFRLLVIVVPQSIEPVAYKNRFRHREGKNCVEVSSSELIQGLFAGAAADPSYRRSKIPISRISSTTEDQLRRRLAASDPAKAALDLRTLLTRLGLVFEDSDDLNYAGDILLRTRHAAAIDYSHRSVPGGPSSQRVNDGGYSLLEEIGRVEEAAMRNNPVTEITTGFGVQRLRALPERALREAILNGVCHRDWLDPAPTTVEHIGNELRVTSPGGFVRDITAANIITHPSVPRYRQLMGAVRQLGLVEQEGIGVDLMVADLIRIGSTPPLIELTAGPAVRVVLAGREPSEQHHVFFSELVPAAAAADDVDAALVIHRASQPGTPFVTAESCAQLLQRSQADAANALRRVATYATAGGTPILNPMKVVDGSSPAWLLSSRAKFMLGVVRASDPSISTLAWAEERGRINSTEYCALTGLSTPTAVAHLKALAAAGNLVPSSATGKGRGFHYLYALGAQ
jgi:ATP-dependent DNA helicase RecG